MVVFFNNEADVTMESFVLEAANSGQSVVPILSDDTDVFVLLGYRVNSADLQRKVQMERWCGSVLQIYATCADLGQTYLQGLSTCATTSNPYSKGDVIALNTMVSGNYQGVS